MQDPAKIGLQTTQNQSDDFFSGKRPVLMSAYSQVYETLWRMAELGEGPLPEVARLLAEDDSPDPDLPPDEITQNARFDSVWQDYKLRSSPAPTKLAEPELFTQLLRAKHRRTVRKLVKRSYWLRTSHLGRFLWEHPDKFIEIKASARFPKSRARQIEFLARRIGAMFAGYKPSTGDRYIPGLVEWCALCKERPAAIDLCQTEQSYVAGSGRPWCGAC